MGPHGRSPLSPLRGPGSPLSEMTIPRRFASLPAWPFPLGHCAMDDACETRLSIPLLPVHPLPLTFRDASLHFWLHEDGRKSPCSAGGFIESGHHFRFSRHPRDRRSRGTGSVAKPRAGCGRCKCFSSSTSTSGVPSSGGPDTRGDRCGDRYTVRQSTFGPSDRSNRDSRWTDLSRSRCDTRPECSPGPQLDCKESYGQSVERRGCREYRRFAG